MIIAIDFDGTIVHNDHEYEDLETPLAFMPGARDALLALKAAGHLLILWSARANLALRRNPNLDPLVRAGLRPPFASPRAVQIARYEQMLDFVAKELPGVFDAVDDGRCGKITADVYVDDKALRYGRGGLAMNWQRIARHYGEPARIVQPQLIRSV